MDSLEGVVALLHVRGRHNLARLLEEAEYSSYGVFANAGGYIRAPFPAYEQLRVNTHDYNEVTVAFKEITGLDLMEVILNTESLQLESLCRQLEDLKKTAIDYSRGFGVSIHDFEEYHANHDNLTKQLKDLRLDITLPFPDLSKLRDTFDEQGSSNPQRVSWINQGFKPIEDRLSNVLSTDADIPFDPTGWAEIDRMINKLKHTLHAASHVEDFSSVGQLCERALQELGNTVFDANQHPPIHGDEEDNRVAQYNVSENDAKRKIRRYMFTECKSSSVSKLLRQIVPRVYKIVQAAKHDTDSTREKARASVISTIALVEHIKALSDNTSQNPETPVVEDLPW